MATAFRHLPFRFILNEYGKDRFIKDWPTIRKEFRSDEPLDQKPLAIFDAIWGIWTIGDSQYPVSSYVAGLSKKRRAILRLIVKHPGISVYRLSLKQGREYSSVHKDVNRLIQQELLDAVVIRTPTGRTQKKLSAPHSINFRLLQRQQDLSSSK